MRPSDFSTEQGRPTLTCASKRARKYQLCELHNQVPSESKGIRKEGIKIIQVMENYDIEAVEMEVATHDQILEIFLANSIC